MNLKEWTISYIDSLRESQITETLKITRQSKDYATGPDFTVFKVDGLPQFSINVNSSAGWSTDPHDKRGRELRLMDRGNRRATLYWKEGNLKALAKQMHDLTSETTWGEGRGLTPDDYYKVLKMWVDMGLHESVNESTNKTNLVEKLNTLLETNVPTNPSKWSYYKSQAKKKFDVYPSAYANAWAAKKYKAAGGGWKKESVNEIKLSSDEKQKLDKAISITDKVKAGKGRKEAIMYIVKLAKEKTGNYPRTLKQALYFLDYLDESINEAKFKYDPKIDYFDEYELLPQEVQDALDAHDFDDDSYSAAKKTIKQLNKVGWTADYELSGDMTDLKPLGESVNEVSWAEMEKIDAIQKQIKKHIQVNHKDSIDYKRDRWMKGYSDLVGHGGKGLNKKNLKNIAKLAKQKNDKKLMKLLSDLSNI